MITQPMTMQITKPKAISQRVVSLRRAVGRGVLTGVAILKEQRTAAERHGNRTGGAILTAFTTEITEATETDFHSSVTRIE